MKASRTAPGRLSSAGRRRGIAVSTIGNLAAPIAGFLSAPILAQVLGVEGRGEVGAAMAPLMLAAGMLTIGLPEAVTYYVAKRPALWPRLTFRACLCLAGCGIAGTAGIYLLALELAGGDRDIRQLINLAALALAPSLVLAGLRAAAAGLQLWGLIAAERFASSFVRLLAIALLAMSHNLTVLTGTLTLAATTVVGGLVYVFIPRALKTRDIHSAAEADSGRPRLLSFGLRMWAGALTGILLARLDQVLMVPLASAYELGLYVVAVAVSEMVLVFNKAVRDVTFASESGLPDRARLAFASRISTLVTLGGAGAVGVASIWGIPLLFGSGFAPAVPATLILLAGAILGNPGSVAGAGLSARGRPGLRSWSMVIAVLINIGLALVLIPPYGAAGAAAATLVGSATAGMLNVVWLRIFFAIPVKDFLLLRRTDVQYLVSTLAALRPKARTRAAGPK